MLNMGIPARSLIACKSTGLEKWTVAMDRLTKMMIPYGGFPAAALCLTRAEALRDFGTNSHEKRVSRLVEVLCKELGVPANVCGEISGAALLHDIGKFAIPLDLLQKTAPLTKEEVALLKTHSATGREILNAAGESFLDLAAELAWTHHERFDGTGYPRGLTGADIPLGARILSVCDIYDALRQDRPYRRGMLHSKAVDVILVGDGRTQPEHFAPDVLVAFRSCAQKIKAIYQWAR
jgi:putative two-component system response regulator